MKKNFEETGNLMKKLYHNHNNSGKTTKSIRTLWPELRMGKLSYRVTDRSSVIASAHLYGLSLEDLQK